MKIDRRCFLSMGIGGAAGAALSPLPWKLMDDVSIWSQNWPWTPVPEDGEVSFVNSTCSLCPGGCGITVRKVNNRPVKIEGMVGHPVNNGRLCILGLAGLQLLFGPTRIQTPLKRVGKRGEGKWQKISWQAAISEVVSHLKDLREKGESHTVAGIMGSDRGTVPQLFERLLSVYGSPNFFRMPSMQDSYELALYLMHGTQSMAGFDIGNADLVISFGSGLIEGWGSPVHVFQANSQRKVKGSRLIQVESRLSNTAAKADLWLPIIPGTEAALAMGLAHMVIREKRYGGFVSQYGHGFDEWSDRSGKKRKGFRQIALEEYSPEKVSEITGIEKEKIEALGKAFISAKRPLAIGGRGSGVKPGSVKELMAIHALNALVGNINQPGGVWGIPEPDYIQWPEPEIDRVASVGIQKGRVDGARSGRNTHTQYLVNRLPGVMESGKPYPLKALFVAEANPCYSLPDAKAVAGAISKVPFVVSFSSYMDETAQISDLILPNHTFLERYEDIPAPTGLARPVIGLLRPVVDPLFNTKHLGDVVLEVARGLGGPITEAFPWPDYQSCLQATLGNKWPRMEKSGFWANLNFEPPNWDKAFDTPSGRFEFAATLLAAESKGDGDALPGYQPVMPEGDSGTFPLILIAYDTLCLPGGYIGSPPFLIKTVPETLLKGINGFVEINPETAKEYQLKQGDLAILQTPKAHVKVQVNLYQGIRPGVIAMARGLGHTAYDEYINNKGVNVNELMGATEDPISGLDAAWGIRAKLVKA